MTAASTTAGDATPALLSRQWIIAKAGFNRWLVPPPAVVRTPDQRVGPNTELVAPASRLASSQSPLSRIDHDAWVMTT
jgi:hypothetical protein